MRYLRGRTEEGHVTHGEQLARDALPLEPGFQALKERHEASFIQRTQKYYVQTYVIKSSGIFTPLAFSV